MSKRYVPKTWEEAIKYYSCENYEAEIQADIMETFQEFKCPWCGQYWEEDRDRSYIRTREIDKCGNCRRQFSWRHGTIFVDSALPLWQWCVIIWYVANNEKTSSYEPRRRMGMRQETSWGLIKKIKEHIKTDARFREWVFGEWSWFQKYKIESSIGRNPDSPPALPGLGRITPNLCGRAGCA